MPDARGNFKGQGWSKGREEGWERVFGPKPLGDFARQFYEYNCACAGSGPCQCPGPMAGERDA
jgi:hypothetical protein